MSTVVEVYVCMYIGIFHIQGPWTLRQEVPQKGYEIPPTP